MSEKVIDLSQRPEGCRAKLFDDGERTQIPVCLGGVSIVGCNNASECRQLFGERRGRQSTVPVVFEEDNTVTRVVTVHRGPILAKEFTNKDEANGV